MTACHYRYFAGVLVAYALFSPSVVSAKGFVLITWGETISHVGDVSSPKPNQQNLGGNKVGYESSYFGVFWIDLWTWGGTYCVYEGDRYAPIHPAEAGRLMGKQESDLSTPFLYRFPLGLLILGGAAGLLVPLMILGLIVERVEKAKASRLLQDPIYQRALEISCAPTVHADPVGPVEPGPSPPATSPADNQGDTGPAFEAAVRYLTDSGVGPEEAVLNLKLIIRNDPSERRSAAASLKGAIAPQTRDITCSDCQTTFAIDIPTDAEGVPKDSVFVRCPNKNCNATSIWSPEDLKDELEQDPTKRDLKNLTPAGWLLTLVTVAVAVICCTLLGMWAHDLGFRGRWSLGLFCVAGVIPAVMTFLLGRQLLSWFSIQVFQRRTFEFGRVNKEDAAR